MSEPAADPGLPKGTRVGEYVVDVQLGAGAFGSVFVATHPVIGKRVAVKVLSRKYSDDEQIVSRFVAEARAVNAIEHDNIVDIFSFGRLDDGRHYFVMELLDGPTLSAHLAKKKRLTLGETLEILEPIARALDAAHKAGIAHRDLKPANIVLARRSDDTTRPKLLDFGIAKLMNASVPREHSTDTGTVVGTPHYMSPEQCRGTNVDHRTDIYAFGVMAFQLLTGLLPFNATNTLEIMMKHVSDPPPDVTVFRPELPAAVSAILRACLDKSPDRRPQTLMDVVRALREAGRDFMTSEAPPSPAPFPGDASVITRNDQPALPAASTEDRRARSRSPVVMVALMGSVAAVALATAVLGVFEPAGPPAPAQPAPREPLVAKTMVEPVAAAPPSPEPVTSTRTIALEPSPPPSPAPVKRVATGKAKDRKPADRKKPAEDSIDQW